MTFFLRSLYNRRRHGSLGVSILQAKNSSELSSPYPSPTLTESSSSSCPDTAEAVYQSKDIARELSDLVVYLEPVKFSGFKAVRIHLPLISQVTIDVSYYRTVLASVCVMNLSAFHKDLCPARSYFTMSASIVSACRVVRSGGPQRCTLSQRMWPRKCPRRVLSTSSPLTQVCQ